MDDMYYEICNECMGYGDDYYIDDDGELINSCSDCPFNDGGD